MLNKIIMSIKNFVWFCKYYKIIKSTLKIKKSKFNKKLFIFGNGKSLELLDQKKIKKYLKNDFEVLCMNNFITSDFANELDINYYLIADRRIYQPENSDFSVDKKAETLKMHKILSSKNIKIFLPVEFYKDKKFSNETFYFNNNYNKFSNNYSDIIRSNNLMSLSGLKALMIGIFLGYKEIYVCGLDNDQWKYVKINKDNKIISDTRYFQKNTNFHENKEKNMSNYLKTYSDIFKSYENFKSHKIFNLDEHSYINCFNKKHNLDVYKK